MKTHDLFGWWEPFFKFAIVRNPWDKALSEYLWRQRRKEARVSFDSFETFLRAALTGWEFSGDDARHLLLQKEFVVSATEECLVDYLGRYETLETDLKHIAQRIGVEFRDFPVINSSQSSSKSSTAYYNPTTRQMVAELWGEDVEFFGYEFPLSMVSMATSQGAAPATKPGNMNQKPSLFIHIGHGKTGSTTIQHALQNHADELRSRGLLVADGNLQFPVSGPIKCHPLLPFDRLLRQLPIAAARLELQVILSGLKELIEKEGFRGAVISSENLSAEGGAKLFEDWKRDFDVHIIYYVRRQDEWIESAWKQWGIKQGFTLAEYARQQIKLGRPDYLNRARAWRAAGTTIKVIPLNGIPDIVRSFWDILGLTDFTPTPTPPQNQTFDWSILDVLSKNPHLFSSVRDNHLFELLERLLPDSAPRDGHSLLSAESVQEIMDTHKESNQELHREFFPEFLPLNDYPPKRPPAAAPDPSDGTAGIYRFMGLQLLMLSTMDHRITNLGAHAQLQTGSIKSKETACQIVKLGSRLKKLEEENRALRQKTLEVEGKMSRSVSKRLRAWLRKRRGSLEPKA